MLRNRRKFGSQTSDNIERWKAVSREKSQKRKDQKKEDAGARKGRKSRNTMFSRGFVAPEGWKVGSLKRRVRRHLGRWEMKSCTPLWREAHLEVTCVKTEGSDHFGSWDVEKVHAVVARSTFRSQNVQNTTCSRHFWGSDLKKVHAVVARSTFRSQNVQNTRCSDHFCRSDVASLRFGSLHYIIRSTTLQYITLHYYTPQHYNYNYRTTQLHSTTLHYII